MRRIQVGALVVGVLGLAASAVGALIGGGNTFFHSYLTSYTFWVGLALGSLGIVFTQFLTGGNWGLATRRILEAAASTTPIMAILFLPLLLGLPDLYAWARPGDVAADAVLVHKAIYLNVPFFIIRTITYLVIWIVLSVILSRLSNRADIPRLQRFSIVGAIVLGVTVSFAAIDWLMSLDADWFSTMYPPLVAMSFMLFAFAFGIVLLVWLKPRTPLGELVTPGLLNDLGSLLLAFLMLWAYMAYFQYLLIWSGNLTDEIPWYLRRVEGGWLNVAIAVAVLGFLVPFWFLLFRPLKRNPRTLAALAMLVIVMHLVEVYWLVQPPFAPEGPSISWMDLATLLGIGGVWVALFARRLVARSVLPEGDPRLVRMLEVAREPA